MPGKVFVLVSGNIGCGKTTITNIISQTFGLKKFEESVDDNPYLSLFYQDMNKWCYKLQRYLLFARVVAHEKISMSQESAIQDRSIYEDMEVFARNQVNNNLWTKEEFRKYNAFCEIISKELIPPDLLIYLKAPVPLLKQRIIQRGREFEQELAKPENDYLQQLNELYNAWISSYNLGPKLVIDSGKFDILNNEHDLHQILSMIGKALE